MDGPGARVHGRQASPVLQYLERLLGELSDEMSGEVARYIPELGRADPRAFGICLATVDGNLYEVGDSRMAHTIQSMSKPFTYGHALEVLGRDRVLDQVGVEPTGDAFNSIILDDLRNRPFNPMVNAGAIAVSELMPGTGPAEREAGLMSLFSALAGRELSLDTRVYDSEKATGHRNRAIAYMMLNSGMIRSDPEEVLDLYFRQCSLLVSAADMAIMAATLANHGTNPLTGERIYSAETVRDVLTLMSTCGMYNYAGEWAYDVGIPAKSGVSGGIIAVIPGQLGIAVYAPPLDEHGNSIRGVKVCQALSRDFSLHAFSDRTNVHTVIRRQFGADAVGSKRMRSGRERDHLREHGHRIRVIEVQGALYFGSAEVLTRRMASFADEAASLIIDFKRANYSDPAADRLIAETARVVLEQGCRLCFSNLAEDGPLARLAALVSDPQVAPGLERMTDTDAALEHYEDLLLDTRLGEARPTKFGFAELDLFRGIETAELRHLERMVESFQYEAGTLILKEGDEARLFYIVAKGSASIFINLKGGARKRVGSVGPGFSFGEMALLDGGRRSADVVADERTICYGFSVQRIRELAETQPGLYAKILSNLVRSLSDRLRLANEEIRALE